MRNAALLLSLAVSLAGCGQTQPAREKRAVSAIPKLDGRVERDEELPGRPVAFVDPYGVKITDAGLKNLKQASP
jgi:hypothetical protein